MVLLWRLCDDLLYEERLVFVVVRWEFFCKNSLVITHFINSVKFDYFYYGSSKGFTKNVCGIKRCLIFRSGN